MKRLSHFLIVLLMFGVFTLTGCNFPGRTTKTAQVVHPTDTPIPLGNTENVTATSQASSGESTQTVAGVLSETPTIESTLTPTIKATEVCTDKAELVKEVSVPDGSPFSPGDAFVKTWQLRNIGNCIWTEQYKIVFNGGDQMNGTSPVTLTKAVPQGETVDISISLTAPADYGSYKGEWLLQNQSGKSFGLGEDAKTALNVQINVVESVTGFEMKEPTWEDTFKSSKNWYLLHTGNTQWSLKKGHLIMKAFSAGKRDEWGLATRPPLDDFFMEATFTTGDDCEGRDRYGLLVRATPPNSGYIFSFACDGYYRFYRWDGENYFALQEWKEDANINAGPNQINRMGILAEGDSFELYANGKLLGEYEDDTFDYGKFGVLIGAGETSNLIIYVEDIAYWLLDE
jgi:hypothetical protein